MDFYEIISTLESNATKQVATVISPDYMGAKAIWVNGKQIFTSDNSITWPDSKELVKVNDKVHIIKQASTQFFIETLLDKKQIIICGAGHISIPIIKMGKMLGFYVTVIDDRPLFANNARKAGADRVICEAFEDALAKLAGDENCFFVIVTRGHRYDQVCLEKILAKRNAYIGMIGSRVRVKKVLEGLLEIGLEEQKLKQVHTPIGLDIKAETPEEIAVAIIAEIIQVKNTNKGTSGYPEDILNEILNSEHSNIRKALLTIISKKGSAPREIGTKMLVLEDGTTIGTIGGGCVEASLLQNALYCIKNQTTEIIENDMTGRDAEEDGMVCGGIIKVLIELVN